MMVMGHVCSIPSAAASLKNSNPSKMSCSRPITHAVVMSCCYYRDLVDIPPSHLPINPFHLLIHPSIDLSIHPFIDPSIHSSISYHVSSLTYSIHVAASDPVEHISRQVVSAIEHYHHHIQHRAACTDNITAYNDLWHCIHYLSSDMRDR